MQDTNNENTQRLQSNRDQPQPDAGEQTMPTRAARPAAGSEEGPDTTVKITVVRSNPVESVETTQPTAVEPGGKKQQPSKETRGARRWPWILLGLLMVIVLGGSGAWMGYQTAVKMRQEAYDAKKVDLAKEYFMAGLVSQQNKQYDIARQQFEAVIKLQPDFPGAQDKLREVLTTMMIAMTPTPPPTATPLPTMTPTKDLRPMEDIFNQAKQAYAAKDWDTMFAIIDQMRTQDPSFHAVDIDGMLYFAYRFRGIDKILKQANLEGGLYDLALAERYGPLDQDAKGYQSWARQYLAGASFWDVDWKKVVDSFEQIYGAFPYMMDASHMTAIDRYRIAAKNYADQLFAAGDACGATEYYAKSLGAAPDGNVAVTATAVELVCHPPTKTPTPTVPPTATQPAPVNPPAQETPQPGGETPVPPPPSP